MEAIYPDRETDKSEVSMKFLKNERGIALATVLVLSAVCLGIMAALIYMVTAKTQFSGMQKRYYTALEAGKGGTDTIYQVIGAAAGGDNTTVNSSISTFLSDPSLAGLSPVITTPGSCTSTSSPGNGSVPYTGLAAKLKTGTKKADGTQNWSSGCDTSVTITPGSTGTYDLQFDFVGTNPFLGANNPTYRVYAKIVDTVEGSPIGSDSGLRNQGTTSSGGTGGVGMHFLYTIEIDAENLANPAERAKLSVLYQY